MGVNPILNQTGLQIFFRSLQNQRLYESKKLFSKLQGRFIQQKKTKNQNWKWLL
jgi:hypothetical protein